MNELEKKKIFQSCEKFINGHYPRKMKDLFADLAAQTGAEETADFYGKGAVIEEFEAEIATLLGKPAALFLPSGTMAQLIALRIWCDRKNSKHIAMHATSHLALHEQSAYEHLNGMTATFLGDAERCLELRDFAGVDENSPLAAALIELPHRELGGVLPPWSDVIAMSELCRAHDVRFHLDGARLWESAPFYERSYAEICALFDSVYVSFYKGLGGITGAALAGPSDFIDEARVWQRRYGGNLYRLFPYVISARESLKLRLPRMKVYHEKAREIAAALSSIDGIEVLPRVPSTNMMHLHFAREASALEASFLEIARDEKIMGFTKLVAGIGGELCKAELTVGDATLDVSTQTITDVFAKALQLSKQS